MGEAFWQQAGQQGAFAFIMISLGIAFIGALFAFLWKAMSVIGQNYLQPAMRQHLDLVDVCKENLGALVEQGKVQATKSVEIAATNSAIAAGVDGLNEKLSEYPSGNTLKKLLEDAKCKDDLCEALNINRGKLDEILERLREYKRRKEESE